MDVFRLHKTRFRKVSAAFLVLFFFSSQAFSCCLFNQQIGDYLKSSLAAILPFTTEPDAHACCPSKEDPKGAHGKQGTSESSGCCIQDANAKVPQIASDGVIQPSFPTLVVAHLAPLDIGKSTRHFAISPRESLSDPPLYLTHRQLLI
jgi:hypothetical protein